MSLLGLQHALTSLIRLPKQNRGDLTKFLADFDLTEGERAAANAVGEDEELNKYGNEQATQRWEKIEKKIKNLLTFASREWIEDLWFHEYEPGAMLVEGDLNGRELFTIGFLEFLLTDAVVRAELAEKGPPFIFDLIAYTKAECEVMRWVPDEPALIDNTLLKHRLFRVVRLDHDIPDVIERALAEVDPGLSKLVPIVRPLTVLMLKDGDQLFRKFEVEPVVGDFLDAQLDGARDVALSEEFYQNLVELGLCFQRG